MKISNSSLDYINQTYTNTAAKANPEKAAVESDALETKTDSINLSEKTRDLQKISQAMETEPEDRTERLKEIKDQVQANQYNINAEQIAEKMIGSITDELT
ncbi:flagellar biosynthesis anti-sigma factor FlgM [Desulfospira joergensenii]|uniref:flagellar biosynthesis anti-sigma factor FlgM n=1 Tax=Desulfospira joergensenii TaxID=53329 RepID=UPI0003B5ACC5|nr:flagellar biosynthesis anti-sigma factor FlgM [Desulfospira joergensenii]